jgi:hypothetical protein
MKCVVASFYVNEERLKQLGHNLSNEFNLLADSGIFLKKLHLVTELDHQQDVLLTALLEEQLKEILFHYNEEDLNQCIQHQDELKAMIQAWIRRYTYKSHEMEE